MNQDTPTSLARPEWDEVLAHYNPTMRRHWDTALHRPLQLWLRLQLQEDEEDRALLSDMCFSHYWRLRDVEQAWAAISMAPPWHGLLT